jgi:hypothetical protein
MNNEQPRTLPKPTTYDELYPGRFLKAGELHGKKVTVTIASADVEELIGENNEKKIKAILSFEGKSKKLVACKTVGICIKAMFGSKLADWVGKRITLFPDVWNGEDCIRVWGSPDIDRNIDVEVSLPRRRPFKKTMQAMKSERHTGAQSPPARQPASEHADAEPDFPPEPGSRG